MYWDFENIVISRYESVRGPNAWRDDGVGRRYAKPEIAEYLNQARIDVDALVGYAAGLGEVVLGRAYANWASPALGSYARPLAEHTVDLVQLFPLGAGKNGADIRLALDVVDDLRRYPHLTHVVVCAGDSDYVPLAQRCRRSGRRVHGIGIRRHTSRFWTAACHEFRYYDSLVPPGAEPPAEDAAADTDTARDLLLRAMRELQPAQATGWVKRVWIKPALRRLHPDFSEEAFGFETFTAFLRSYENDLLEVREANGTGDMLVRLLGDPAPAPGPAPVTPAARRAAEYRKVWAAQSLKLLADPARTWPMVEHGARLLARAAADGAVFETLRDARAVVEQRCDGDPADAKRIAQLVTRVADLLRRHPDEPLVVGPVDPADAPRRAQRALVNRLRGKAEELDPEALAVALFGPSPGAAEHARVAELLAQPDVSGYTAAIRAPVPSPAVLWQVADALQNADPGTLVDGPEGLRALLSAGPETGADVAELWALLGRAGVLGETGVDGWSVIGAEFRHDAAAVVTAVGRCWIEELRAAGLEPDPDVLAEMLLYDRYRADLRDRIAELVRDSA